MSERKIEDADLFRFLSSVLAFDNAELRKQKAEVESKLCYMQMEVEKQRICKKYDLKDTEGFNEKGDIVTKTG